MGTPGNNVTTVRFNIPINYYSRKEFVCLGMNCLYRILTDLVHVLVLKLIFKAVFLNICSGQISCNNNLNSKLKLLNINLSELTIHTKLQEAHHLLFTLGKRNKVC